MARPTVVSVSPSNNSIDVSLDTEIYATFSQGIGHWPLDGTTVNTSTVYIEVINGAIVPSEITIINNYTIQIVPTAILLQDTRFEVCLVGDTDLSDEVAEGITDIEGNSMAGIYKWTFTTELTEVEEPGEEEEEEPITEPNYQAFKIMKVKPKESAVNLPELKKVEIEFSNNVKSSTIIGSNIYVLKKSNM